MCPDMHGKFDGLCWLGARSITAYCDRFKRCWSGSAMISVSFPAKKRLLACARSLLFSDAPTTNKHKDDNASSGE